MARSTNPAELANTPVNSDDEFDAEEDLANLPLNQQPLPIPDHDTIMRERYVEGGAFEYMTQRGYAARDNIRYSDAAATARRRATRQANLERQRVYRENSMREAAGSSVPLFTPDHLPEPRVVAPTEEPAAAAADPPSAEDPGTFDLMALFSAAARN
jgi:hypothetical protein